MRIGAGWVKAAAGASSGEESRTSSSRKGLGECGSVSAWGWVGQSDSSVWGFFDGGKIPITLHQQFKNVMFSGSRSQVPVRVITSSPGHRHSALCLRGCICLGSVI